MQSPKARALTVGLILFVGIFFSLGKIRYAINPILRTVRLQQYLGMVKQENAIDPEKFWEFRDFYTATTSSFKPQNIQSGKPFLSYATNYFSSNDYLLKPEVKFNSRYQVCINTMSLNCRYKTFLRIEGASIVTDTKDNKLYIEFTTNLEGMQKANGFFRYFGVNLEQYKDYVWYNETVINL
jgi:hypothetical protein